MITGLKKNKFTQTLATGAAALGVLAGVGLASSPAQAGVFNLGPQNGGGVVPDSEWGDPGPEPIWSTFPLGPVGTVCIHGAPCVDGYDNPLITKTPGSTIKFNFYGSGTSQQTNNLFWDANSNNIGDPGEAIFPKMPNGSTSAGDACGSPKPNPSTNNFGTVCDMSATYTVPDTGILPILFFAGTPGPGTYIPNGTSYNGTNPHYFATIDGTLDTTSGSAVYLGLSDRFGATGDDDAADFVVKIENVSVPEPGTVLGLLAVGGLGAFMKRKKQG